MLNYFIEKGHQQNDRNGQPFFFRIMHEIYGGEVSRKIISSVTPDFYPFF